MEEEIICEGDAKTSVAAKRVSECDKRAPGSAHLTGNRGDNPQFQLYPCERVTEAEFCAQPEILPDGGQEGLSDPNYESVESLPKMKDE